MKRTLTFIIITFLTQLGIAQDWNQIKNKDGILVYTRKVESSKYEQIKIILTIDAKMSEVVRALEDVEHHPNWVYATEKSNVINKIAYNEMEYYVAMNVPFPLKDRDVNIYLTRQQNPKDKTVVINSIAKAELTGTNEDYVRIKDFTSKYTLTPQGDNKIKVEYFLAVDPGGSIPAWAVNMFTTKGPIKTMEGLVEILASGYYKDVKVEGILD